jgi:hypothetical protein
MILILTLSLALLGYEEDFMFRDFALRMAELESANRYAPEDPAADTDHFGMYQFSKDRLIDLGLMRKNDLGFAVWKKSYSYADFIANKNRVQDEAFYCHVLDYAARLADPRYQDIIQSYSLPGLIAVAHLIGFKGVVLWARADEDVKAVHPLFRDGNDTRANSRYATFKGFDISDILGNNQPTEETPDEATPENKKRRTRRKTA